MTQEQAGNGAAQADRITQMLDDGLSTPAGWREAMSWLETDAGPGVYAVLLFVLTQLDFAPEKAREHWQNILLQWEELNRRVPEKVDLRVAVLQYFLGSQRKLHNPAVVEIRMLPRGQDPAIYDELTRLYNLRYFQDRVVAEVRRALRYDAPLSLALVDADDFRAFNEAHGRLVGNMALRRLASALRRAVREVDLVCRYGGEKFAVLLPNTSKRGALQVGEKLRQAVEQAGVGREDEAGRKALTVSVGVASLPGDAANAEELVCRAERALHIAKGLGKNVVQAFSEERRRHARLDLVLPGRLRLLEKAGRAFTTLDLSEAGVLLLGKEPLEPGTLVHLEILVPPGRATVECTARVLRSADARGGFEIAAEILHMPRTHQRRYRSCLKELRASARAASGNGSRPREEPPGDGDRPAL